METLLIKAASDDDYGSEVKFLEASYCQDGDTGTLSGQLSVLEAMLMCFDHILSAAGRRFQNQRRSPFRKSKQSAGCLL